MRPLPRNRFVEERLKKHSDPETQEKKAEPSPPLDCAKAWAEVEKKADSIINSTQDPILRNRRINAAYAQLYLKDPSLHWAGVAAFASKQVGCGMTDAKEVMDRADMEMKILSSGMPGTGESVDSLTLIKSGYAKTVYDALVLGNSRVFKDIYPVHLFYEQHGIEGLRQCGKSRTPPVDPKVMAGFEDIAGGHSDKGAVKILQHEQHDILQVKDIFGNKEVSDTMKLNQSVSEWWGLRTLAGARKTTTAFSANCEGGPTVTFEGSNPADYNERWPFAQKVAQEFETLIGKTSSQSQVDQELDAIIHRGK